MITSERVGFFSICAASTVISLLPFAWGPSEPSTSAHAAVDPLSADQMTLLGAFGLLSFAVIGVALFRHFTPPPSPFVVEYISPKLDPEELRNL
jgi:hypothetical protein